MHFLICLWLFLDYSPTPNEDREDEGEKKRKQIQTYMRHPEVEATQSNSNVIILAN